MGIFELTVGLAWLAALVIPSILLWEIIKGPDKQP